MSRRRSRDSNLAAEASELKPSCVRGPFFSYQARLPLDGMVWQREVRRSTNFCVFHFVIVWNLRHNFKTQFQDLSFLESSPNSETFIELSFAKGNKVLLSRSSLGHVYPCISFLKRSSGTWLPSTKLDLVLQLAAPLDLNWPGQCQEVRRRPSLLRTQSPADTEPFMLTV